MKKLIVNLFCIALTGLVFYVSAYLAFSNRLYMGAAVLFLTLLIWRLKSFMDHVFGEENRSKGNSSGCFVKYGKDISKMAILIPKNADHINYDIGLKINDADYEGSLNIYIKDGYVCDVLADGDKEPCRVRFRNTHVDTITSDALNISVLLKDGTRFFIKFEKKLRSRVCFSYLSQGVI